MKYWDHKNEKKVNKILQELGVENNSFWFKSKAGF
jgi:hypothetical protein